MFAVVAEHRSAIPSGDGDYWSLSRGPLASLIFIAPLLALYEWGVLRLGPQAIRNGADLWLRGLLDGLGLGHYFLLPALTIVLLLTSHHLSGDCWRLPPRLLACMLLESSALAICLVLLARMQGAVLGSLGMPLAPPMASVSLIDGSLFGRLVAFVGAGVYEEVLFRLMLLPLSIAMFRRLGVARWQSVLWGIVLTSMIFAVAHYIGPHGDKWQAYSFLFRTMAGSFFALLFVYRGFGITAGAHTGYDILVGMC